MTLQQTGSKASEKPYHVLDGGKIRCEKCGKLAKWVDSAETETGYMCPGCAGIEVD
jgi:DNA-directed RNA polymerase subunit RPC12/RpoP